MPNQNDDLIDSLSSEISTDVGNILHDELELISDNFDKSLSNALKAFNSNIFDDSGFIKKLRNLDLDDDKNKNTVKNVLSNMRSDYINVESLNQTEVLLKRDIKNICTQMPEMRDVIRLIRDNIIESSIATGEVSRTVKFNNYGDRNDNKYEEQVKNMEDNFNLLQAIKNFIIPHTLESGEMAVHIVPFAKLFAELEILHDKKYPNFNNNLASDNRVFKESIPVDVSNYYSDANTSTLYTEENLNLLVESVSPISKINVSEDHQNEKKKAYNENIVVKSELKGILENIEVSSGESILHSEIGDDGFKEFLFNEYNDYLSKNPENHVKRVYDNPFLESIGTFDGNKVGGGEFNKIDQEDVDYSKYKDIKGCYIKYLDPLKTVPIRIDRRIIGYYYVTTTMDLQGNAAHPNGMVDLSFQHYTKDRNIVDRLSSMIIKSFNKRMLDKNIQLKNEICEIIMAHKFSEGKLSFVYIPENEVVRFVINEDEMGKGHSVIEPTLFPARNYLMMNLYNIIFTLNNNLTRIHYLKSSGLDADYASQIQRTIRAYQSRRITLDDIYSYQGVLNKVGGMGEMVLPLGRSDYKVLETDTIEPVHNPIDTEFIEQQRRQALSGTGAPNLLIINAIDEVDFAKTLELANARFKSTVNSYKIDFNKGITKLYQLILKFNTDIEDDVIKSFIFKFNEAKQQDLDITNDMISNFNNLVELVESIYYNKKDLEDEKDKLKFKRRNLRRALAKKYLPLNIDELDELIDQVERDANSEELQHQIGEIEITDEDIEEVNNNK